MRISFKFKWIPFAAALSVITIGVLLGQWQMRRASEKQAIESKLILRESAPMMNLGAKLVTPETIEYRHVKITGEFLRDWPIYLENRPQQNIAGFYLLMPLRIAGSNRYVLIVRGWLPRNMRDRTQLPALITPSGTIELQGIAKTHLSRVMQLGDPAPLRPRAIVQNVSLADFSAASGLAMQPFIIEQLNDANDGLVRDWPRPSSGIERHLGYAFQWYALAAMAFIFFIVTGCRREPN